MRIGSGSTIEAIPAIQQPRDDRHQRPAGGPEQCHVVTGQQTTRLQRRAH